MVQVRMRRDKAAEAAEADVKLEAEREKSARLREAMSQLEATQSRFVDDMKRLGKGASMWGTYGWQYESPTDWADDPELWPPVAKLLWLFAKVQRASHDASFFTHFPDRPARCGRCGPVEHPYICVWCPEHAAEFDVATAQAMAAALFEVTMPNEAEGTHAVVQHTQPSLHLRIVGVE